MTVSTYITPHKIILKFKKNRSMENQAEEPKSQRSIQDYLSLGYIYLLTLGILREVIYFGFLEINILSYSNVLDVILSPLVLMSEKPMIVTFLIIFSVIVYFFYSYLIKKHKNSSLKPSSPDVKVYTKSDIFQGSIILYAIFVLSFFLGTGIGSGYKHAQTLAKGEFKMTHKITFMDQEKIEAKVLGSNSQYIFYVLKNKKSISISPIPGNVKTIDELLLKD